MITETLIIQHIAIIYETCYGISQKRYEKMYTCTTVPIISYKYNKCEVLSIMPQAYSYKICTINIKLCILIFIIHSLTSLRQSNIRLKFELWEAYI